MKNPKGLRSFSLSLCALVALAAVTPAFAQHGGGWHGSGGGHGGGWRGGGWHGGGWHGGYGWHGGWGWPWGWGLGALGLGLYFASLPYYYSTYWWGGVPYYYADNNYFVWNGNVGQYQTVAPPGGIANQASGVAPTTGQASAPTDLIAYPKNGQSEERLGKDKFECHRWAVSQTGFDPTQPGGGSAGGNRSSYARAQAACLEGRGYSVK